MLKRSSRLRAGEVAVVVRQGKALRARFLSAKILNHGSATIRAAAVVPKSVAKTAVARNRMRRALYRAFATHIPSSAKGFDIVFFLRTLPSDTTLIAQDVETILHLLPRS
ncbi:MAG: ribonuclease P protein component [Patescibacteria group bacterium]|nr:ribonuclease P protein component [Patescibacteria group bacterium]